MKRKSIIRQICFYVLQVFIIGIIALGALWICRWAFYLQSQWTQAVVAIVTSVITLVISIGISNLRKHLRKQKLSAEYKKSEDINFGIDGFAFYDHDDRGYLIGYISIRLLKKYFAYDFEKSFAENAQKCYKLQKIHKTISKLFPHENIEHIVKTIVSGWSKQDSSDSEQPALIIQSMVKNRQDESASRLEASTLRICLFRSNMQTKHLIDGIFNYLRSKYPDVMEASYKTNLKIKIDEHYIDSLVCFATSLKLYGCILKKDGDTESEDDKEKYYLYKTKEPYGIRIPITEDLFNGGSDISGKHLIDLAEITMEPLISSTFDMVHITDVVFAYEEGMIAYFLYTARPHISVNDREDFQLIQNRDITSRKDTKDQLYFYYSYAWSIIRKLKNKRID